jgi:hypothetical protein
MKDDCLSGVALLPGFSTGFPGFSTGFPKDMNAIIRTSQDGCEGTLGGECLRLPWENSRTGKRTVRNFGQFWWPGRLLYNTAEDDSSSQ